MAGYSCSCDFLIISVRQFEQLTFPGEARGVGGIFFDDLDTPNKDEVFKFVTVRMKHFGLDCLAFFIDSSVILNCVQRKQIIATNLLRPFTNLTCCHSLNTFKNRIDI